jgi:hypothetical protein
MIEEVMGTELQKFQTLSDAIHMKDLSRALGGILLSAVGLSFQLVG